MIHAENIPADTELVSFDIWLTLIKSDGRTFKDLRNRMLGSVIAPEVTFEEFDSTTRAVDRQADRVAEERGDDVMFGERVNMVAAAFGKPNLDDDLLGELYEKQTSLLMDHMPVLLDPDTPAILSDLHDDVELAVVSNTGFIHGAEMRKVLGNLGIYPHLDYAVFSNEVGYAKPDARIYKTLLDASGVEPARVLHVGDNRRSDFEGAQSAGMNAFHLDKGMTIRNLVGEN